MSEKRCAFPGCPNPNLERWHKQTDFCMTPACHPFQPPAPEPECDEAMEYDSDFPMPKPRRLGTVTLNLRTAPEPEPRAEGLDDHSYVTLEEELGLTDIPAETSRPAGPKAMREKIEELVALVNTKCRCNGACIDEAWDELYKRRDELTALLHYALRGVEAEAAAEERACNCGHDVPHDTPKDKPVACCRRRGCLCEGGSR